MIDNSSASNMLGQILERLDSIESAIAELSLQKTDYPSGYLTPKEAAPYLKKNKVAQVHEMCRRGDFLPGDELIDTSPKGSERPSYLINVRNYFERLAREQGAS